MSEIILEPLAASVLFLSPVPRPIPEWTEMIKGLLEHVARLCNENGSAVIGHIKGLSLVGDDRYIRVSAISHTLPAQVETNASGDFTDLAMSLNVIVYGLSGHVLEHILRQAAEQCERVHRVTVTVEPKFATTHKAHTHTDHHSEQ